MCEEIASEVAQKIIIKFLANEGVSSNEIHTRIEAQFGTQSLSQQVVTECTQLYNNDLSYRKENPDKISAIIDPSNEHGYAAIKSKKTENFSQKKFIFAKKFREIRPAPPHNITMAKKLINSRKIILSRRICDAKIKSLININKSPLPIKVLVAQPNLIHFKSNLDDRKIVFDPNIENSTILSKNIILEDTIFESRNAPENINLGIENSINTTIDSDLVLKNLVMGLKKIAPKISQVEILTPNVVKKAENLENEIPQGVDKEIIIDSKSQESEIFGENYLTNYAPLAEHRYAILNGDFDKKHRQGKALTSEQKLSAYQTYVHERINKKLSKSQSVSNAAITMGISTGTMWNLVREMEKNGKFAPPKKRRKRSNFYEILDESCKDRLLNIVKQLIKDDQVPTVDKIYLTLRDDDNFPAMSRTTVYNQLKKLGFKYEKRGKEKILKEKKQNNVVTCCM